MENSQCQCIDDLYIFIHLKKLVIFLGYLKFTRGMFFCGLYKASAYETPQPPCRWCLNTYHIWALAEIILGRCLNIGDGICEIRTWNCLKWFHRDWGWFCKISLMFLYMFLYLIGCVSWILWGLRWISARCSSLWSEPVRWNEQYCQRWSRKACKAVAYVVLCMTTVKGPRPSSRYWNFDRVPFLCGWHSAYWFALELSKCIAELKLVIDFESPWGIQKPLQLPVLTLSVTQIRHPDRSFLDIEEISLKCHGCHFHRAMPLASLWWLQLGAKLCR